MNNKANLNKKMKQKFLLQMKQPQQLHKQKLLKNKQAQPIVNQSVENKIEEKNIK